MRSLAICCTAAIGAMATAATAWSASYAPPGNSAVSQYVEVVPTAKGTVPSLKVHSGSGSRESAPIPQTTVQALDRQGTDGRHAAALAAATSPAVYGFGTKERGRGRIQIAAPPVSGSVASPASALVKALTGSATHGLGALLPVILVLGAIGAGLLAAIRRRRT